MVVVVVFSNTIQLSQIKCYFSVSCASTGNSTYQWYNQEVSECTSSARACLSTAPILWNIAWPGTAEQVWVSGALSPCSTARPQAAAREMAEGRQGRLDLDANLIQLRCNSWVWTTLSFILHIWMLVLDKISLVFSWSVQRSWETWWRQLTQPLRSVSIFVLMCQTKWFSALLKLVNSRK